MSISTRSDVVATYRLQFLPEALAEWQALDGSVKTLLRKALKKRLEQPRVPGSELHAELRNCYKIKLRKIGYRLVYAVEDDVLVVPGTLGRQARGDGGLPASDRASSDQEIELIADPVLSDRSSITTSGALLAPGADSPRSRVSEAA